MIEAAAYSDDFIIINYFYNLTKDADIFYYLAKQGKDEIINKLADFSNQLITEQILWGAAEAGNWKLVKKVISPLPYTAIINAVRRSSKSGDLALVEYIWNSANHDANIFVHPDLWDAVLIIAAENKYGGYSRLCSK